MKPTLQLLAGLAAGLLIAANNARQLLEIHRR